MAHFTISVEAIQATIRGNDSFALQNAADQVARRGPAGGGCC